jgi:peptidoglycan hydrolase-like protein with peptidoglycan-binding domain
MLLLKYGMTNDDVRHVQVLLNGLTQITPKLAEDGIFGPKTRNGVIAFQRDNGLIGDGIVGPKTGRALLTRLAVRIRGGAGPAPLGSTRVRRLGL